jgi:hypothetical protein
VVCIDAVRNWSVNRGFSFKFKDKLLISIGVSWRRSLLIWRRHIVNSRATVINTRYIVVWISFFYKKIHPLYTALQFHLLPLTVFGHSTFSSKLMPNPLSWSCWSYHIRKGVYTSIPSTLFTWTQSHRNVLESIEGSSQTRSIDWCRNSFFKGDWR